ncbi:MAG: glutamyl-tRNA reductase [Myxococcales bacterium]|nr:glutamyl-tRNA reductase [Myxococcales bacterium]
MARTSCGLWHRGRVRVRAHGAHVLSRASAARACRTTLARRSARAVGRAGARRVIVVGLSHHATPIAVRERLALTGDALALAEERLLQLPSVSEALLLSTCNRVEVYAAPADAAATESAMREIRGVLMDIGGREVGPHLVTAHGDAALLHVFRVASSLDSMVLGEPQILGQLKQAIALAQAQNAIGPRLLPIFRGAIQVGKRVRHETEIGSGQVSVPSVAVELARQIFDDLAATTALLVGAGEMAEAAAKLLSRLGARLVVVNRSGARAAELAADVGGVARSFDDLASCLTEADVVIASTSSPTPVITHALVRSIHRKRRGRSLFLIDIAVPRDVEPAVNELDNVYLYDIDDLSKVVAQSLDGRAEEARKAERIVREETEAFLVRRSQEAVTPLVVKLRERTERVLERELERSLAGRLKHLGEAERQALASMMHAVLNKLMHGPTARLKELAIQQRSAEAAAVVTELFELDRADTDGHRDGLTEREGSGDEDDDGTLRRKA